MNERFDNLSEFYSQPTHACKNNQCKRASKCVPSNDKIGYTCKCKPGTKGRFCDQGETATKITSMMVEDDENLSNEKPTTNGN